jgi:metallo-beta-lactamase class B
MKMIASLACALALTTGAAQALPFEKQRAEWNKPHQPFHVIGNIYYVGMAGVSSFLIVTPQGDILTDGGLPESAPFIEKNIQALGFKLSDVKILMNSHAHFDHDGGLAQLKKDTGAKLYISAGDTAFVESGHITFGPSSLIDTTPVKVDRVLQDGDTVSLGGTTLTIHTFPGHTPGCTSWTMPVTDHGKTYKVLSFCSITVAGNPLVNNPAQPNIVQEYRSSLAKLKQMDADIFLAPHGGQFHMDEKFAKLKPGAPNPFIDPTEVHTYAARAEKAFEKEYAAQKAGKPPYP